MAAKNLIPCLKSHKSNISNSNVTINLELLNAMIKLREISIVFDEQTALIAKESDLDYINEINKFNTGVFYCMDAIGKMLGESAVNSIYRLIPDNHFTRLE